MTKKVFKFISLLLSALIPVIFSLIVIVLVTQPWELWGQEWFIEEGDDKKFISFLKLWATLIFAFTLTCFAFAHLIKKKKRRLAYWIIGLIHLVVLLFSAFSAQDYSKFRKLFFGSGIKYVVLGFLWISLVCLPLFLMITHAKWLYGSKLKHWFKKNYYKLLNWVIATPIVLLLLYNIRSIYSSISDFEWNFSTTRNIITILFLLVVLAIGSRYVSYRVISRNARQTFFPVFMQLFRFVISILFSYGVIFLTLTFLNPNLKAENVMFFNDFSAAISNANELFPFSLAWKWLLGVHITIWLIANTSLGKKEPKGWHTPNDPWLPENVVETIPKEILEVEKMTKWNRISQKNISKVMKNLDVGLEKLHAQKRKYNQYLERWKNQESLSDQDWREFGNKKGARTQEYSRFSVGSIKQTYLELIYEVDYYIRESNKIQTKYLGHEITEMAFQQTESHNISSKKPIQSNTENEDVALLENETVQAQNVDDFE